MEPPTSYKIVKTKEGKNRSLALVPASWEVSGVLSWPKLKSDTEVNKFIENRTAPGSTPGVEWINCTAKVVETNILTYAAGNAKLSVLLKRRDTSSSTTDNEEIIPSKRARTTRTNTSDKNYSALFTKVSKTLNLLSLPNKLIRTVRFSTAHAGERHGNC